MIRYCPIFIIVFCFSLNVYSKNTDELLYESCSIAKERAYGNKLITENINNAFRYGYCIGILQSVMDLNEFLKIKNSNEALFCKPQEEIENDELVKIFIHYVNQNQEQAKLPEIKTVINAYKDIFPCKK